MLPEDSQVATKVSTSSYVEHPSTPTSKEDTGLFNLGSPSSYGAGIITVFVTAAVVIQQLIRKFSNDKLQWTKDRAETDILATMQAQLKDAQARAEKAEKERNDSATLIGKFTAEVDAQKREIDTFKASLEVLNTKYDEQTALLRKISDENIRLHLQTALLQANAPTPQVGELERDIQNA